MGLCKHCNTLEINVDADTRGVCGSAPSLITGCHSHNTQLHHPSCQHPRPTEGSPAGEEAPVVFHPQRLLTSTWRVGRHTQGCGLLPHLGYIPLVSSLPHNVIATYMEYRQHGPNVACQALHMHHYFQEHGYFDESLRSVVGTDQDGRQLLHNYK